LSGNEDRSGPRGPGALRRFLTGGGGGRPVTILAVVGCAAALLLMAATGAFATSPSDSQRCTAGGCPGPNPFGYPLGTQTISQSILALPSPPKTSEEVFYSHGTPAGATNVHPTAGVVFGEGSDIFALSAGSLFGISPSWPPDLQALPLPQAGIFPFVLRDASDKPIGFGAEMEMLPSPGGLTGANNTHTSDWIVSIPGRGVLWLNSNDNTGDPNLPRVTRPDGSVAVDVSTGPANGHGVIVGGSGEFAKRTGTWDELDIRKPGPPGALGTFEFEMHVHWDQKPKK
jgi:hypothetical protein